MSTLLSALYGPHMGPNVYGVELGDRRQAGTATCRLPQRKPSRLSTTQGTSCLLFALSTPSQWRGSARFTTIRLDRMLVAQALLEPLTLITRDALVPSYSAAFMKVA